MTIMRLEQVTVGYGSGQPVLREVSVSVAAGELLAVTGPSGAGKTTLLSTMAGRLRPSAGAVELAGAAVSSHDQAEPDRGRAVASRVVLVPQDNGLAAILTVEENLEVALIAAGLAPAPARQATTESLARLGLTGQANQLIEELSGGQQQRTAIARALALRGALLLADEVTSELDAGNRQRVLELLRQEADRGAAVVLATHDPAVAAVCDRQVRLVDGQARTADPAGSR